MLSRITPPTLACVTGLADLERPRSATMRVTQVAASCDKVVSKKDLRIRRYIWRFEIASLIINMLHMRFALIIGFLPVLLRNLG